MTLMMAFNDGGRPDIRKDRERGRILWQMFPARLPEIVTCRRDRGEWVRLRGAAEASEEEQEGEKYIKAEKIH